MGLSPFVRANLMPEWEDHGLDLPPGVLVKRDGDFGALMFGPKVVGIRVSSFDRGALPELLHRLGVSQISGAKPLRSEKGQPFSASRA